jgi:16S rRNA G527 N7-methylase RsmG
MKKTIAVSRLALRRETLRALDHMQLDAVRGGNLAADDSGAGAGCPAVIAAIKPQAG